MQGVSESGTVSEDLPEDHEDEESEGEIEHQNDSDASKKHA